MAHLKLGESKGSYFIGEGATTKVPSVNPSLSTIVTFGRDKSNDIILSDLGKGNTTPIDIEYSLLSCPNYYSSLLFLSGLFLFRFDDNR